MARIPTYQKDLYISDLDRIIGTDGDTNELTTKNFFLGDIAEYVIDKFIDPDAVSFTIPVLRDTGDNLGANATRITGSIMSQDTNPDGTKITVAGLLQADKEVKVKGKLVGGVAQSGQLVLNSSLNATGITIKAPTHENLAVSYSMVLPNDIGVAGAQLTTDGVGELYWADPEDDNLTFAGDSGQGLIDLDTETFSIVGGDHVVTTALGQTLTINLEDVVTGSGTAGFLPLWDATGTGLIDSGISQFGGIVYVDNNLSVAGALNMQSNAINNVLDPVNAQDAATKAYVDAGNANQVDGSGTLNYVPLWTPDGNTIGDSIMIQTLISPGVYGLDVGSTRITGVSVAADTLSATTVFATDLNGLNGGTVTLNGNTILGNAATDTVTVNSEISLLGAVKDFSGTLGATDQLLISDASGNLSWTDSANITAASAQKTSILVKNISAADGGVTLTKGTPVYIAGSVGASERLYIDAADASNAAKMPCVGLLDQDLSPNGEGTATVTGKLKNLITSPIDGVTPTENDTLYVKPGGGLTLTKPTGVANLIQNVGQVGRVSTSNDGNIVVSAILRSNDIPNLTQGKIWVGSTGNTIESGFVHLDESLGAMGIGTTSPTEKLTVDGNVKIIGETFQFNFTGDVEHIFSIVPSTSSFGAGSSSLKFGKNNSVTKGGGIAMGQNLISTGEQSQAFGHDNTASGPQSTAFGVNASSTGDQAFAIGNTTNATGGRAFAGGFNTAASGLNSVALGNATVASGTNAMTMGATSTATGFNCFALGLGLINSANASLAVGAYNVDSPGYKFSVGIGTSTSNRANGMAVREDGYVILDALKNSSSYNSDIAAAAGGVPLGALYRDGNTVKIRLT